MADATLVTVSIEAIRFDRMYYPRHDSQSPAKVSEYALSIAEGRFPPILLTHDYRILDGWHRWKASLRCGVPTMEALLLDTTGLDAHTIRRKAARANVRHGLTQTEEELKKLIRDEYRAKLDSLDQAGREALKKDMALDYSRSERYIREATSRIDKDLKAKLRQMAFDLWLACAAQAEIAKAVGYSEAVVSEFVKHLQTFGNGTDAVSKDWAKNVALLPQEAPRAFADDAEESTNSLGTYHLDKRRLVKAHHLDEQYKAPLYNIWRQQEKTAGLTHLVVSLNARDGQIGDDGHNM